MLGFYSHTTVYISVWHCALVLLLSRVEKAWNEAKSKVIINNVPIKQDNAQLNVRNSAELTDLELWQTPDQSSTH